MAAAIVKEAEFEINITIDSCMNNDSNKVIDQDFEDKKKRIVRFSDDEPKIIEPFVLRFETETKLKSKLGRKIRDLKSNLQGGSNRSSGLRHVDSKLLILNREYNNSREGATRGGQSSGTPPDYHYQQTVAGQKIYASGPPPPIDASRAPAYRSGNTNRSPSIGSNDGIFETSFVNTEIRNKFVHKVYLILCVQLLITFGFIALCVHIHELKYFVLTNIIVFYLVLIGYLVLSISLACFVSLRRNYPVNMILLFAFTFCAAYMLAFPSCVYGTTAFYMATGLTTLICLLITVFAWQTKWDITNCGVVLCILLIGLLIYGLICSILVFFISPGTFRILHLVYAGLAGALFCLFLMYDTQQIMGGRRIEMSPEEYILGALTLYIDIIIIFQSLLTLVGLCRQ